MAGIYIHIPFCKQACHYCNFHFSTSLQYKNEFLEALLKEIVIRKKEYEGEQIETIYFGGGTPGLLTVSEIGRILDTVRQHYNCDQVQETTLEMNPDDVIQDKIEGFNSLGVDRISLGVQSFYEEDLRYMNRSHSAEKAKESINIIRETFRNYTVDLIYGYPMLSDEKLESNVSALLAQSVPHISIYGMTVEPKTALDVFIKKGKERPLSSEQGAKQFEYLMNTLSSQGYEHYEISSYARGGYRAIHNSNYWEGKPYLGFGPGAHSYKNNTRSWNVANNALYIKALDANELNQDNETLSTHDLLNEFVLLGLRVKEGIDMSVYKQLSNATQFDRFSSKVEAYIRDGLLEQNDVRISLTQRGKLFCDGISADLFV